MAVGSDSTDLGSGLGSAFCAATVGGQVGGNGAFAGVCGTVAALSFVADAATGAAPSPCDVLVIASPLTRKWCGMRDDGSAKVVCGM